MYYGWRIVAACFTILFVIVGVIYYSFPVFYAPLIEEFHWRRADVTAGFAFSILLIGPLFGIFAGHWIDRFGAKRVLLVGLLAEGMAFLGFSRMRSLGMYYVCYFLQTVGYVSAGPVPNQVLIAHWFTRRRGRAMGLAYVGIGVGGAAAPVLAHWLITHVGWRPAMLAIGGIVWLILLPLTAALVRNRPSELGLSPDGDPASVAAYDAVGAAPIGLAEAASRRAFWLIMAASALSLGAVGGVIQHLVLYLRDQGFAAERAAQVASFLLVASILGRLTMGYLADRFSKKQVMLATYLLVAAAIPLLYFVKVPGVVYVFALLFGFAMGADYMLIPLMTAECFGLASLGKLMGVILATDSLGQALTPYLVGHLFDRYRSYNGAFALLIVMAALGAAAVSQIPSTNRGESALRAAALMASEERPT